MSNERITSQPPASNGVEPVKASLTNRIAINGLIYFFMVYFSGVALALPYRSWQYANEHGFWAWLFLGERVPAAQSFIWPYYVASSLLEKGWTQEEKENLAHLNRATTAAQKALILLEGFGKTGTVTPTDRARVQDLLKEALDESTLVRDDVLAKVHPDYPSMYREKCVAAFMLLSRLAAGREDAKEFDTAERLLHEWDAWLDAHRKKLRRPKDIPE
ncbi:MAG TPA: hypothetical protein VG013_01050 [Gemmataceae bacterium]|jgi:hypothetical protein|nr:hypothetical protein [Gemmataceae bacterium]